MKLRQGDKFYAILKKGPRSKAFGNAEAAGQRLGPFTMTGTWQVGNHIVAVIAENGEAWERKFLAKEWAFIRVKKGKQHRKE